MYNHVGQLPHAANLKVSGDIIRDYVLFVPTVVAAAPASISGSASVYMENVANYLNALVKADFDVAKVAPGALQPLTESATQQAGNAVLAFSADTCHYQIGSATP